MDLLSEKIKNLPEIDYPAQLHGRIMGNVGALKFKTRFAAVLFLLFLNFIVAGAFFIIRFLDNDALLFIRFMIREFEFSASYFSQLAGVLYDTIPLGLFFTLVINAILIIYIGKFYFLFKKRAWSIVS